MNNACFLKEAVLKFYMPLRIEYPRLISIGGVQIKRGRFRTLRHPRDTINGIS